MAIKPIERILYWCSGTDYNLIERLDRNRTPINDSDKNRRKVMGVTTLFTSVVAFASSFFFALSIFNTTIVAVIVGLVWSGIVINFDRSIFLAQKNIAVLGRLFLSIIIALVVAVPLELELFGPRIEQHINDRTIGKNEDFMKTKNIRINELDKITGTLKNRIDILSQDLSFYIRRMEEEMSGRSPNGNPTPAGDGKKYHEAKRAKNTIEKEISQVRQELESHLVYASSEKDRIIGEYDNLRYKTEYDFLTRYEALEEMKTEKNTILIVAWGLRLLLILIELFPAFQKLFMSTPYYDQVVEIDADLKISKIILLGNHFGSDMEEGKIHWKYSEVFSDMV